MKLLFTLTIPFWLVCCTAPWQKQASEIGSFSLDYALAKGAITPEEYEVAHSLGKIILTRTAPPAKVESGK